MVEIKIEKKKPIWPWIIGLIIIGIILYFFVSKDNTKDHVYDTKTEVREEVVERNITPIASVDEINSYNEYISGSNTSLNHEFTRNAFTKLITATSATAMALNVDVDRHLEEASDKVKEFAKDSTSIKYADKIRDAAHSISKALKTIQTEKYPELEPQYKEVEVAVKNINTDTPTSNEKDEIRGFLRKSSNLLTSIRNDYGQAK